MPDTSISGSGTPAIDCSADPQTFLLLAAPRIGSGTLCQAKTPDYSNLMVLKRDLAGLSRGTAVLPIGEAGAEPDLANGNAVRILSMADLNKRQAPETAIVGCDVVSLKSLLQAHGAKLGIQALVKETGLHFTQNGRPLKNRIALSLLLDRNIAEEAPTGSTQEISKYSKISVPHSPFERTGLLCKYAGDVIDILARLEQGLDLPQLNGPDSRFELPTSDLTRYLSSDVSHELPRDKRFLTCTGLVAQLMKSSDSYWFRGFAATVGQPSLTFSVSKSRDDTFALDIYRDKDDRALVQAIAEKLDLKFANPTTHTPVSVLPLKGNLVALDLKRIFLGSSVNWEAIAHSLLMTSARRFSDSDNAFEIVKDGHKFLAAVTFGQLPHLMDIKVERGPDGVIFARLRPDMRSATICLHFLPDYKPRSSEPWTRNQSKVPYYGASTTALFNEFLDCLRSQE